MKNKTIKIIAILLILVVGNYLFFVYKVSPNKFDFF